jgi:hypothetical protein
MVFILIIKLTGTVVGFIVRDDQENVSDSALLADVTSEKHWKISTETAFRGRNMKNREK